MIKTALFRYKRDKRNKMKIYKGKKGASIRGQIPYSKVKMMGSALSVSN